jgi:hypothetical protein
MYNTSFVQNSCLQHLIYTKLVYTTPLVYNTSYLQHFNLQPSFIQYLSFKVADLAAGRALVADPTHKRRNLARIKMLKVVRDIVERGEGTHQDILKALVAATDKG